MEDKEKKQFALIEGAISCGSPTVGSEGAYDALMSGGLGEIFPEAAWFPMEKAVPCREFPPGLRHLDTVMGVSRRLRANILTALEEDRFPIIIGGDHSIAMGSLAAMGETYGAENLAVVYIDAHADINTEHTSVSGYIHGMDLAAACGLCGPALDVGTQKVNLLGKNIHILGGRSIDPPEYAIMARQAVRFHSAREVHQRGVGAVLEELMPEIQDKRVHISFDVDSLDPSVFSSTGYLLPNGLTLAQVELILRTVLATGRVCGFECVEYNPRLDRTGRDLNTLLRLFRLVREQLTKVWKA